MKGRRQARVLALQALYEADVAYHDPARALQDRLDLRTVRGFASHPAVLQQAGEAVDALQLPIGGPGGEAIIPDELADDGAVLLLDERLVVLLVDA